MRIGLLNNLRAGRSHAQVSRVLHFLRHRRDIVSVETDSAGAVPEALSDLSRREVDLLLVNGGDGTLQHALTEILEHRVFDGRVPLIAPLRGGRTNMSALDLGAHRDPVKGLAGLLRALEFGELEQRVCPRSVLRVEYGPRGEVLCGMFFGAGNIYRAIELVHRVFPPGRSRGVFGATVVTATLLGRLCIGDTQGVLEPDKYQVMLDGEPLSDSEIGILISSSLHRLFARMRPFWAPPGDSGLALTAVANRATDKARGFPGMLRGKPRPFLTPENGYVSRRVRRAEIRMDCGFTVDGELVAPEPDRNVTLTADHTVRFVRA